jgi:hypothetical protein
MTWDVAFHPDFLAEYDEFSAEVQDELQAIIKLLAEFGPQLKRPGADTLNGSKHANMKELRFDADKGVWRVAYAFDSDRRGILLVGGDKSGVSSRKFYKALIRKADERFDEHLAALEAARRKK